MRASCFAAVVAALAWLTAPSSARSAVVLDAEAPTLAIGANGLGIFAYRDRTNGDLMVGRCVDAACSSVTTSVVDSAGDVGRWPAIAWTAPGPVIAYEDSTNHDVKLALCADPACAAANTVVVDPSVDEIGGISVAVGWDGRPLVAYINYTTAQIQPHVRVAHCDNGGCTAATITEIPATAVLGQGVDIAIGGDGLGAITWTNRFLVESEVAYAHCANTACTAFSAPSGAAPRSAESSDPDGNFISDAYPSLAIGTDGAGLPSWAGASTNLFGGAGNAFLKRCQSPTCTTTTVQTFQGSFDPPSLAIDVNNRPRIVVHQESEPGLDLITCLDPGCAQSQRSCLAGLGASPSLVLDGTGQALVAYEVGDNVAVTPGPASCGPIVAVGNTSRTEAVGPTPMLFTVRLGPRQATPVTLAYTTVDGSAVAGVDYTAASGIITFPPQADTVVIPVDILPDALDEPNETFSLVLSNATGAVLVDGEAVGTILDDDEPPVVDVGDCAVVEGDTGTTGCVFEARLSAAYPLDVTVQYATVPGTASAGTDYLTQSGALTIPSGSRSQTVSVSVVGDVSVEPDETFSLLLSNPVNATPGDVSAEATIVDDDSPSLSDIELTHGTTLTADLAAAPGPAADQDLYRLAQSPFASYEAVLDAVSGDAAPGVRLERLAADGSTVLQTGTPVGTGSAVSLRFQNRIAAPLVGQYIRVAGAACGTGCGPDDTYRLRLYETTGVIARFNNAASQVTVLLLQNPTSTPTVANVDFWDANGSRLATQPASLPPHGVFALNTSTLSALAGSSGSITVSHDGAHGSLIGKAVALAPSTGFSFDSPMVVKPR